MADNTVNDDDKDTAPKADAAGDDKREAAPNRPKAPAKPRAKAKPQDGDSTPRSRAADKAPPRRATKPRPAKAESNPSRDGDNDDRTRRKSAKSGDDRANDRGSNDRGSNALSSGAFWGAAAAGVGVGIALMLGRKVAVQAPTVLAGDWDKALALEHRAVEKLFDLMQATTTKNTTKRNVLLMQLKHALAKHAMQEENAVYPALRDAGMVEGADELNREHGYVKQYLYELDNCAKDSEEFLQIVARFRADIEHHVREEEEVLYPKMKEQLSEEANDKLTAAMNKEGFKIA